MSIFDSLKNKKETESSSSQDIYQIGKKSPARAKPSREQAGSVRVGGVSSKAPVSMTKEEKKEARRKAQEAEDRVMIITNMLMKEDKVYAKRRKIWWAVIIVGLINIAVSWYFMEQAKKGGSGMTESPLSIATLVIAYVCIIGGFIFDFTKIQSLRKATAVKVQAMSLKRQQEMVAAYYAERDAKKAAKQKDGNKGQKEADSEAVSSHTDKNENK